MYGSGDIGPRDRGTTSDANDDLSRNQDACVGACPDVVTDIQPVLLMPVTMTRTRVFLSGLQSVSPVLETPAGDVLNGVVNVIAEVNGGNIPSVIGVEFLLDGFRFDTDLILLQFTVRLSGF